jgi:hypothetical protein
MKRMRAKRAPRSPIMISSILYSSSSKLFYVLVRQALDFRGFWGYFGRIFGFDFGRIFSAVFDLDFGWFCSRLQFDVKRRVYLCFWPLRALFERFGNFGTQLAVCSMPALLKGVLVPLRPGRVLDRTFAHREQECPSRTVSVSRKVQKAQEIGLLSTWVGS